MNILAKLAMVLSMLYYVLTSAYLWFGQIGGLHNEVWSEFNYPEQSVSPPAWSLSAGLILTGLALTGLGLAYRALWSILDGGTQQDFRHLARALKRLSAGLFGFWFFYNLLTAIMPHLIGIGLVVPVKPEYDWDPLGIDIISLILAIVIFAISQTLKRAWEAEEETKHFL